MDRLETGRMGEDEAARYLWRLGDGPSWAKLSGRAEGSGYHRPRDGILAFVEVKCRTGEVLRTPTGSHHLGEATGDRSGGQGLASGAGLSLPGPLIRFDAYRYVVRRGLARSLSTCRMPGGWGSLAEPQGPTEDWAKRPWKPSVFWASPCLTPRGV